MSEYPSVTGRRLIKALIRLGYIKIRQDGSHVSFRHPDNPKIITVIQDTIKDLKKGTLEGIKKQLKLSRKEFIEILRTC